MNPLDFSWTEDQQVTVINPTDEPFKFKVHNKDYQVGAHKNAKMPGYIAWVYVYNMATIAAQNDGVFQRWNEEDFRKTYYDRFVKNVDAIMEELEEEEEPDVNTFEEADLPDGPTEDEFADDEDQDKTETPKTTTVQPMTAKVAPSSVQNTNKKTTTPR